MQCGHPRVGISVPMPCPTTTRILGPPPDHVKDRLWAPGRGPITLVRARGTELGGGFRAGARWGIMRPMSGDTCPYVSRGGLKLAAALDAFGLSPAGWTCADLGCNVGGFTDCLLRRGAVRVHAVDTGYGALAWSLRKDPRVVVAERTNALRADPPEAVDLVVIDVAWTPQRLILPAARRWLAPAGQVVSLLKPQYEAAAEEARRTPRGPANHVLNPQAARRQCLRSCRGIVDAGWDLRAVAVCPILSGKGNTEFLLWLRP